VCPLSQGQGAIAVEERAKGDALTEDRWRQLRQELEADQEETVAEIGRLKAALKYELETDPEEGDPDLYEREKTLALLGNLEDKDYSLSRALSMLDDGSYGKCEICGKEIGAERLEALPYTTYCVECKALVEKGIIAGPDRQLAR
jgi:DnaK suppressor protein